MAKKGVDYRKRQSKGECVHHINCRRAEFGTFVHLFPDLINNPEKLEARTSFGLVISNLTLYHMNYFYVNFQDIA